MAVKTSPKKKSKGAKTGKPKAAARAKASTVSRPATASANGKASYKHTPSVQEIQRLYRIMLVSRRLEERYMKLFRQGRFHGNVFPGVGEEAATCIPTALLAKKDWVMPSHRECGAAVAKGLTLREMTLHEFARLAGLDKGKSHPGHWGSIELNFVVGASTVAGQIPLATGVGWASKIKGDDAVAMAFFGDGATARGDFHEALNFAGIHKLGCIFVCKNNLWAESVPVKWNCGAERISDRAAGYGMPGYTVDGNDTFAMYDVAKEAVERARRGDGPTLIEAVTYRWYGHSAVDPANYRTQDEVDEWKAKDPLARLEAHMLKAKIYTQSELDAILAGVEEEIDDAVHHSEASPIAPPEEALTDVYYGE